MFICDKIEHSSLTPNDTSGSPEFFILQVMLYCMYWQKLGPSSTKKGYYNFANWYLILTILILLSQGVGGHFWVYKHPLTNLGTPGQHHSPLLYYK